MSDRFLKSCVLPGTPVERQEYRRLLAVLLFVTAAAIAMFFTIWYAEPLPEQYAAQTTDRIVNMRVRIMAQLNDSIVQLSPESIIAIRKELDRSKIVLSESQKETIRKQLEATAVN
jgi:hypothetical protein